FFTYTVIIAGGVRWPVALGIIFWAGVAFLLVSATPLRQRIPMSFPVHLRAATAAGIGLLLTFIGLQNGGFVAANPATLVGVGPLAPRALFVLAALIVSVWLSKRENPLAYVAGIALVTGGAWAFGYVVPPASWFSAPDFSSVFLKLDVWGASMVHRTRLLERVPQAGRVGRAPPLAAAGDDHGDAHRSVRLAVDVHWCRAGGEPRRRKRRTEDPSPGSHRRLIRHVRCGAGRDLVGHRVCREHRRH